jgi:hypothetical protein
VDSTVALALMRKAQLVFEHEGTFLSFPLTALAYEQDDFDFMDSAPDAGRIAALAEYSIEVDRIPRGPVSVLDSTDRLSEVYADVLRSATLAKSARTPDEEQRYQQALAYLYEDAGDGTRRDSAPLVAYKTYRDAWFRAQEAYNSAKVDAEYATDPAVKRKWDEVDEPALRGAVADAERDWNAKGFRADVDRALGVETTLGARAPSTVWAQWRQQCNADIDQLTDPRSGQSFLPSGFSPSNLFAADGWTPFELKGDAVEALARDAPAELRGRLEDQADVDVESLSFEVTSMRVDRPWLATGLFGARFWALPSGVDPLSSGGASPAGRCPAYVAALVLARNLVVQLKPDSPRTATLIGSLHAGALSIAGLRLVPASPAPAPGRPLLLKATVAPTRATAAIAGVATGRATVTPAQAALARARIERLRAGSFTRPPRVLTGRPIKPPIRFPVGPPIKPPVGPPVAPPTRPPAAAPPDHHVYVLAFICRRVPACPDPDPQLQW